MENEWDNIHYHSGTIEDYLNELSVITAVAHAYGFKVADAGITSTSLRRWMYSQLTGDAQEQWKATYYVGLNNNYTTLLKAVNAYTEGIKRISIDFTNVHWYNLVSCGAGFESATQTYMKACGKTAVVCNEFGIRTNSTELFRETVDEIRGKAYYALAYSGASSSSGKAITLTDEMLAMLK